MRRRFLLPLPVLILSLLMGCGKTTDETAREVYQAALVDDLETLQELLKKDPSLARGRPNAFNKKTPLHYAKSTRVIKALLDAGAAINAKDVDGHTPLHMASHREIVDFFLEHGADVHARGTTGLTPLHTVVYYEVAAALLRHGAEVNARARYGITPLYAQGLDDRVSVMQLLLEHGADPNLAESKKGYSPLHWAAAYGIKESVRVLLKGKAAVDAKDNSGATPLRLAVARDRLGMAELLLKNGADPKKAGAASSPAMKKLLHKFERPQHRYPLRK